MPIYGKTTKKKIDNAVTDLKEFKAGNIHGEKTDSVNFGRLPEDWREMFYMHRRNYGVDYIIYSYATPIAWKLSETKETLNTWVVPPVSYSQSTTGQQLAVKNTLHLNGYHNVANTSLWEK